MDFVNRLQTTAGTALIITLEILRVKNIITQDEFNEILGSIETEPTNGTIIIDRVDKILKGATE